MRIVTAAIAALLLAPAAAHAGDLTLTVKEVQSAQGSVLAAVWDNAAAFPKPPAAKARCKVKAAQGHVTCVFHNLAAGRYAFIAFHDANDNGKLDRNSLGVPTEGYAFSNNAVGSGGPPSFDQAAFSFSGANQSMAIALDY